MQNIGKDVIQPKLSCIADESVKGTDTLKNSFVVLYNVCLYTFYHIMD